MTFIEKYNKIMSEKQQSQQTIQQHVVRTYDEILNSVGAYTDQKLGADEIPLHGLIKRPEGGNEGETLKVKETETPKNTKIDIKNPKTKLDSVAKQIYDEFKKDGISKGYRDNLKNGVDDKKFDTFIWIVDELDKMEDTSNIWREMPPAS